MSSLADYMVKTLLDCGVTNMFGYPGGATLDVMESAYQQGLRFTLPRSEWAAAYMAAMTGDLSGTPGVVISTLGPGATNLLNGVSHAYLDRSPLLAITGRLGLSSSRTTHQRVSQRNLFETVTKWSTTLTASGSADIGRALRVAVAERPGPVHLDLPSDQTKLDAGSSNYECERVEVHYGGLSDPDLVVSRLKASQRPLVLVGPAAIRHKSGPALRNFVEQWGIPVLTSVKAKGVLDERHPYWAGVVDMAGAVRVKEFLRSADLLLAIGFDAVELIGHWDVNVPTIHIDSVPNTDFVYRADLEIIGDIAQILESLARISVPTPKWGEEEVQTFVTSLVRALTPHLPGTVPSGIAFAAREILPEGTIVVTDTGSHKVLLGQLWRSYRPKTYFVSNGLGTMGFGLPAAIAAKMYSPEEPVVCFSGDGGFAMVSSELATAVENSCPVILVVFRDGSLDRILRKQEASHLTPTGTLFSNPNLMQLAESYSVNAFTAANLNEFSKALDTALRLSQPTLIDVPINSQEYKIQFELAGSVPGQGLPINGKSDY